MKPNCQQHGRRGEWKDEKTFLFWGDHAEVEPGHEHRACQPKQRYHDLQDLHLGSISLPPPLPKDVYLCRRAIRFWPEPMPSRSGAALRHLRRLFREGDSRVWGDAGS
jgi:hypothetical protein